MYPILRSRPTSAASARSRPRTPKRKESVAAVFSPAGAAVMAARDHSKGVTFQAGLGFAGVVQRLRQHLSAAHVNLGIEVSARG